MSPRPTDPNPNGQPSPQTGERTEPGLQVVVRPIGSPLAMGFLALMVATVSFAVVQVGWLPNTQARTVALCTLALTVPLQLLASVLAFLARDVVAGTGMGILAGTWAAVGLVTLGSAPGETSPALGTLLLVSAVALVVPAVAAETKLVPAAVIALSAVRFGVTGIGHVTGSDAWLTAAGWVGLALGLLATYAALALALEDARHRTVLPLGRRGVPVMVAPLRDELADVAHEAGVRRAL